jgi:TRAP-type uncharacterized transport system substrate-binding protein
MNGFKNFFKDATIGLYEVTQDKLRELLQFLKETWPFLLILLTMLFIVILLADPSPPKHIILATGPKGSSLEEVGKKYAEFFSKRGITLETRSTLGSEENFILLKNKNKPVHAAFVLGGMISPSDTGGVFSLGSIQYQPIWFFYRKGSINIIDENIVNFTKGKIAIGKVGSGTHAIAMKIFDVNASDKKNNLILTSGSDSVTAIQRGEIDGVFLADAFESHNVQTLLTDPKINLANFKRAPAYTRQFNFLEQLDVPMCAFNLNRNFPPEDTKLISTSIDLLVDENLHPAIQFLFMQAAKEINGKETFFSKHGEFPSFKNADIPESPIAVRFNSKGTPWLMDYIPFRFAEFIDRMFLLLLPLAAFVYPFLTSLPSYRKRRIRIKINKIYGELKFFEFEVIHSYDTSKQNEYSQHLDKLERQIIALKIPNSIASDYYPLRTSIDYVRKYLSDLKQPL